MAKGDNVLFGSLRKRHSGGWRAGIMRGERETALAIVRTAKGRRPLLRHCAVHPTIEIQAELRSRCGIAVCLATIHVRLRRLGLRHKKRR